MLSAYTLKVLEPWKQPSENSKAAVTSFGRHYCASKGCVVGVVISLAYLLSSCCASSLDTLLSVLCVVLPTCAVCKAADCLVCDNYFHHGTHCPMFAQEMIGKPHWVARTCVLQCCPIMHDKWGLLQFLAFGEQFKVTLARLPVRPLVWVPRCKMVCDKLASVEPTPSQSGKKCLKPS